MLRYVQRLTEARAWSAASNYIGMDQNDVEYKVPGAVGGPGLVALPDSLPRPEVVSNVAPGNPALVAIDDPLDYLPVIPPGRTDQGR